MNNDEAMKRADLMSIDHGSPVNIAFEDGDYSVMLTVDEDHVYIGIGESWEDAFDDCENRCIDA